MYERLMMIKGRRAPSLGTAFSATSCCAEKQSHQLNMKVCYKMAFVVESTQMQGMK
jgi:hypothetical protein